MTTIDAKLVANSIGPMHKTIYTLQTRSPRWIHAEARTHRIISLGEEEYEVKTPSPMEDRNLSRNAGSSRARPVSTMIEEVMTDPAIPLYWGRKQSGMVANEEANAVVEHPIYGKLDRIEAWLKARDEAVKWAEAYDKAGYHKQMVNRLLEPFSHIDVVWTATEWDNFFHLRLHKDAEPHMRMLAIAISEAIAGSQEPRMLEPGEWHLPYILDHERTMFGNDELKRLSASRCAAVSYKPFDDNPSYEKEFDRFERIIISDPVHATPSEHQASPDDWNHDMVEGEAPGYKFPWLHGNFYGWIQHRQQIPNHYFTPQTNFAHALDAML